jgi:hypothetical protein
VRFPGCGLPPVQRRQFASNLRRGRRPGDVGESLSASARHPLPAATKPRIIPQWERGSVRREITPPRTDRPARGIWATSGNVESLEPIRPECVNQPDRPACAWARCSQDRVREQTATTPEGCGIFKNNPWKKSANATKPRKANGNGANLGFEAQLFLAADKLRKNLEPSDYKHVALGLIFLKYISNAFEAKRAALLAEDLPPRTR